MLSIGFLYAIDNWHSTTFHYTVSETPLNSSFEFLRTKIRFVQFLENMNFGAKTAKIVIVNIHM